MRKMKWASGLVIAMLISTVFIGGIPAAIVASAEEAASATAVLLETPAVVAGAAEFSNHTTLTCLPEGVQVSGEPVAPVVRNDINLAGTPMRIQLSGLNADALAAGVVLKMPATSDQAVMAYYDENRKPVPGWIIQPGSQTVTENGQRFVLARVHRFSVYAPVVLNARLAADSITEDDVPLQYTEQFIFPYVPEGYVIKIMNTSKPELISIDGVVTIPPFDMDTKATVNFRIFKADDVADTENMVVNVLAPTSAKGSQAAVEALQSVGKIFGMLQYAGNTNDLQTAFKALETAKQTDLQKLLGKDVTVPKLYSLFLAYQMELEKICEQNRETILEASQRSDAELMACFDIYKMQAWQSTCQQDNYRWFTNRLQELGWSLELVDFGQQRLSEILDHGDACRLNQMRSYLRANTQLIDGQRRLSMGGRESYRLAFFGYDPQFNPLDELVMTSNAPKVLSLSGPDGKPLETGTMNPLWVVERGTAEVTVSLMNNRDPLAYLTKFMVGGSVKPGIFRETLPDGLANVAYSADLLDYGGYGTTTWEIKDGNLPGGLTLDNGVISGVPQEYGTFEFEVSMTDGNNEVYKEFTLVIMKNSSARDVLNYLRSRQDYYLDPLERQAFTDAMIDVQAMSVYQWSKILPPMLTPQVRQIYH